MKIQVSERLKKHNSYWETRVQKIFDERERGIKADDLYRRVYNDMHAEIKALYNELGGRDLTRTELYKASKFLSFRAHLQESLTDISGSLDDSMSRALISAYKDAGLAAKDSIGAKTTWTVTNRKMAEAAVQRKWAGDDFSGRIWKNRDRLAKQVEKGVTNILTTGYGRNDLLRELNRQPYRERFAPKGADQSDIEAELEAYLQRGRRQADCLVRTELMHAINTAQIETYRSEGVKYLEFECEPTACPDCIEIANGNPYSIDKLPCTIGHPRCRCTWLAVEDEDVNQQKSNDPPPDKVEDCKTVAEVEELFRGKGWFVSNSKSQFDENKNLSLKGCDLEASKGVYEACEAIFTKYPQLIGKLNSVTVKTLKPSTYAQCWVGSGHGGVELNKRHFENAEQLKKSYERSAGSFHPAGTDWTSIVTHEFGHAIDDYLSNELHLAGRLSSGRYKRMSAKMRPAVMRACGLTVSDIGREVSGYATYNASEWFAESFAEYLNSKTPRKVAAELGRRLDEILKGV